MAQGANREMRLTGTSSYRFSLETTIDVEKIGQAHLFFEVRRGSAPSPAERLGIPPRPARKALAPPRPDGMALDAMGVVAIPDATDESSGFVAGLVLEPDWKPDSLWSGLSGVFDQFTVRDAGLILSSIEDDNFALPELPMGYVPSKIEPGITFFSALELSGKVFEPLRHLFASTGELDLYAHIDTRSLANSEIVALLPGDDGHKDISFTGLEIGMKPGKGEFTIKAGARFTLWSEHLTLEGSGAIVLGTTPTIAFTIRIADWEEPFGIAGLVVESFGLSFGVDPGGVLIGLDGQFLIGSDPATQFRFGIGGAVYDFEAPSAIEFTLESGSKRPLKVTDLVEQFVPSLDLSAVPLLNGIAFVKLDFYVVANPGGWIIAGKKFPQGVGIDADLLLYDWELKLLLQVSKEDGILADGELNKPIYVLDVLTISNAAGDKGPSLKIDTTGLMPAAPTPMQRVDEQRRRRELAAIEGVEPAATGINPYTVLTVGDPSKVYFAASGAVKVLGLTERFSGSITSDGFEVNFHADLDKLFRADVMAAFSKSSGFEGHASGNFDFRLSFPDGVSIDGWPLLPPCEIVGPYASLAFDLVLKTTEAYVAFDLDFNWGEFHFHPKFRLDAKDIPRMLEDLWTHIVDWIEGNLRTFFAAVLADVTAYLKALEDGFLWAGQGAVEIAKTLYHLFDVTGIEELAADLVRIGRLQFSGMVDALIALFDISYAAAVAVLRKIGEQCAVASNEAVLYSSNPERL
jgi:hypothetical protein